MSSDDRYERLLELRKIGGTFRSLKQHPTRSSTRAGPSSRLIDFVSASLLSSSSLAAILIGCPAKQSSNDYLSLTRSRAVKDRYLHRLAAVPPSETIFGSTGSRLLDGTSPSHTALEDRLARFFDSPSALLFNSGWDANVSFFSSVPQRGDYIVYDELVHASVWDGMRTGERRGVRSADRRAFKHNDMQDLRIVLERVIHQIESAQSTSTAEAPILFIALETLYSMDGDLLPLPSLIQLLETLSSAHPTAFSKSNVWVVLDEAHTTGAFGRGGRGFVEAVIEDQIRPLASAVGQGSRSDGPGVESDFANQVMDWVKVRVMTFGKAVGGQGAVLLSSRMIRSFLINYARPFIFSTAMSVSNVLAIESAFDVLDSEEGRRRRTDLSNISQHALSGLERLLADPSSKIPPTLLSLLPPSASPFPSVSGRGKRDATAILPLITPHPHSLADHLRSLGFLVRPIVHPTVPKGKERVRICLHAGNSVGDVDRLVEGVASWAKRERNAENGREGRSSRTFVSLKARL